MRTTGDLHDDLNGLPDREVFAAANLKRMIDRRLVIQGPEHDRDQVLHPQRLNDRPHAAGQRKDERRYLQQPRQAGGEMVFGAKDERSLKDSVRNPGTTDMFLGDALGLEDRISR